MKMILNEKHIQVIFLFEFKMGHKAMETTHSAGHLQQHIWPRNCWGTYSAVVVQQVLQRKQES